MLGEGAKATIVASVIASIVAVLVTVIGISSQNQDDSGAMPQEITVIDTDTLNRQSKQIEILSQKLHTAEAKIVQLEKQSQKSLLKRCVAKVAPKESVAGIFGKGSVAMCAEDELAISGACQVAAGSGTNSRFLMDNGRLAGYECVLAQGASLDRVRATAVCCQ